MVTFTLQWPLLSGKGSSIPIRKGLVRQTASVRGAVSDTGTRLFDGAIALPTSVNEFKKHNSHSQKAAIGQHS
jgi:hypothetical protein